MADAALDVREHVPLAPFSTLGIGGPARWFVRATDAGAVAAAHRWARTRGVDLFVLGGGSNLVIADTGIEALVLQVVIPGVAFTDVDGSTFLHAGAGERWDAVVAAAVERGLAGLECLSGIPGSVGGTPIQNVGAYGQEVADTIDTVTVFDRRNERPLTLRADECEFAYRMSRFKAADARRFIVTGVTFRLSAGPGAATYPDVVAYLGPERATSPTVAAVRAAVLDIRRRKGMILDDNDPDTRSVGSFFMNPIVSGQTRDRIASTVEQKVPAFDLPNGRAKIPAAWLIERSGFHKGFADGAVGISTKHPLALVNRGGATARDVLRLAARIKRQVGERFGVALRPEPIFVGLDDDPDVTYLRSETL